MNHIRQINLLIKRILCRPAMIVVLLVIPAVLIAVSFLPARKQSTEIVSGVYIESSDEHTDAFLSYLTSTSTGFTFRHYESLKDMKDDVASGRIDSAYMVPDGFSESMIHSDGKRHITVYTTDGSSFQSVSEESVYAALLYAYAADMSVCMLQDRYLANVPYDETQMSEYISDRFKGYIENEDIFIHGIDRYCAKQFSCGNIGLHNFVRMFSPGTSELSPGSGLWGLLYPLLQKKSRILCKKYSSGNYSRCHYQLYILDHIFRHQWLSQCPAAYRRSVSHQPCCCTYIQSDIQAL